MPGTRTARTLAAVLVAAGLAACTTSQSSDMAGRMLVGRGQYQFYDCAQLVVQAKSLETRHRELTALIAKAKQGTGGGLVSALSYEPDLAVTRGQMADLRREQAEKKCQPGASVPTLPARPS